MIEINLARPKHVTRTDGALSFRVYNREDEVTRVWVAVRRGYLPDMSCMDRTIGSSFRRKVSPWRKA